MCKGLVVEIFDERPEVVSGRSTPTCVNGRKMIERTNWIVDYYRCTLHTFGYGQKGEWDDGIVVRTAHLVVDVT